MREEGGGSFIVRTNSHAMNERSLVSSMFRQRQWLLSHKMATLSGPRKGTELQSAVSHDSHLQSAGGTLSKSGII